MRFTHIAVRKIVEILCGSNRAMIRNHAVAVFSVLSWSSVSDFVLLPNLHNKPPCDLLHFPNAIRAWRDLHSLGIFLFFKKKNYIHHSGRTQAFGSMAGDVVN